MMPTRGRREWAFDAVMCYVHQTYPAKELLILDDEDDPSFPDPSFLPSGQSIRYIRGPKLNIPKKRNKLATIAEGELICHFDSDDWQHPDRIRQQVEFLEASGKSIVGFHSLLFARGQEAWRYKGEENAPCGSSFLYTKALWAEIKFPETVPIGSDMRLGRHASKIHKLKSCDVGELLVMRVHQFNSSPKQVQDRTHYRPIPWTDLPELFRVNYGQTCGPIYASNRVSETARSAESR